MKNTLTALIGAASLSQAAVIHTSFDGRFDASVTIATVADGSLKFTVDFNNADVDALGATNIRLAYVQFQDWESVIGNRINTSDPDEILVQTYADGVTENPRGRTYFSLRDPESWGLTDEQYFQPGETDVFFIEPVGETHSFDADTLFARPVRLYFQHELAWDPYYTHTIDVTTRVSPAVPEPSTSLLALAGLLPIIRRKR